MRKRCSGVWVEERRENKPDFAGIARQPVSEVCRALPDLKGNDLAAPAAQRIKDSIDFPSKCMHRRLTSFFSTGVWSWHEEYIRVLVESSSGKVELLVLVFFALHISHVVARTVDPRWGTRNST